MERAGDAGHVGLEGDGGGELEYELGGQSLGVIDAVALVAVVSAFAFVGQTAGGALALVLVGARLLLSPVVVYALGHVLALGIRPSLSLSAIAVLEIALLSVLARSARLRSRPRFVRAFGPLAVGLAGLTLLVATQLQSLWMVFALLVATVGLAGYGLHRYELVELGLTE
jgi:hypothetical protein